MPLQYSVTYLAENHYDTQVNNAVLQFLIIPENNDNQEVISYKFNNSLNVPYQVSINGYGFKTFRLHPRQPFKDIRFKASFKLLKLEVNPFDFIPDLDVVAGYRDLETLDFKVRMEPFLRVTRHTYLPENVKKLFRFDSRKSIFDNLVELNHWVYIHLYFKPGTTGVDTTLEEIVKHRNGVCQDFTHLFCAIARKHHVPVRYVSGYLHQGNGYFGDSQMHAWPEAFIPKVGWVGFDPTNDLLAGNNHIKVAHGKDYQDCAQLKGVIYAPGSNRTTHSVEVQGRQVQQ